MNDGSELDANGAMPFIPLGRSGRKLYFYSKSLCGVVEIDAMRGTVPPYDGGLYMLAPLDWWQSLPEFRTNRAVITDFLISISAAKGAPPKGGIEERGCGPWIPGNGQSGKLVWNDGARIFLPDSGMNDLWCAGACVGDGGHVYVSDQRAPLSEQPVTHDEMRALTALIGRLAPAVNLSHYVYLEAAIYWGIAWQAVRERLMMWLHGPAASGKTWYLSILERIWQSSLWEARSPEIIDGCDSVIVMGGVVSNNTLSSFKKHGNRPVIAASRGDPRKRLNAAGLQSDFISISLSAPAATPSLAEQYWEESCYLADKLLTVDFCSRLRHAIVMDVNRLLPARISEMGKMLHDLPPARALPATRVTAAAMAMARVLYPWLSDREFVKLVGTRV